MKSRIFFLRFLGFVLFVILLPVIGQGALIWSNPQIELTTKPGDKEAVGLFRFENSGKSPVTITSVQPSCGCTTAELEKRTYASGEKGEIKAVFTLGDRVGAQEKIIYVATDDASARPVALVLHVMIPELLTCAPRLLMWKVGETPDEKIAVISANTKLQIVGVEISSATPADVVIHIETKEAGVSYQLFVRPISSAHVMNVPVSVVAKFADGTSQPIKVYALVR